MTKDSPISVISESEAYLFNTLAQLPTALQANDIQRLNRRAKSKWYSDKISQALYDSFGMKGQELHEYYKRATTCNQELKRNGSTITGKYCNARHCHICNRIRTAKAINHYKKQFQELSELEFTTLTIPNCNGEELRRTIEIMTKAISNICRVLREKRGIDFNGVRKMEITYNHTTDTYHPHLHILHSGNCGSIIIQEWLKRFPTANIKAQDTKEANQESVKELFKYTTKVLVKDSIDKETISVFLPAIDTIIKAMQNKRSFQTFGKIKIVSEDVEELQSEEYSSLEDNYDTYYVWEQDNWYDLYNHEALTKFIPPRVKFKYYD